MADNNEGHGPEEQVIFQMSKEELEDLLQQARDSATQSAKSVPPVSTGLGTSSSSIPFHATPPVSSGLGIDSIDSSPFAATGLYRTGPSATKPNFKKTGLERQYDFNGEIINILLPIFETSAEEGGIKDDIAKAITHLIQRNELLVIADSDPEVFEYYDQHSRAESLKTSNPILASFLRDKKRRKSRSQSADSPFDSEGRYGPTPLRRICLRFKDGSFALQEVQPRQESAEICVTTAAASAILPNIAVLQKCEERRRRWRAVATAIAEGEKRGHSLCYRWALAEGEKLELQDGALLTQWRGMPLHQKHDRGGNRTSFGGFRLLICCLEL
ncbi:hypothetical protein GCK32_013958 [Trichostrongylus colubriformis]|uniref:Uncharacterized protein n=1 Tax=Trichostrongylus colubriformis TaxID=6319 RepID=A0AAN8EYG0_TRICO